MYLQNQPAKNRHYQISFLRDTIRLWYNLSSYGLVLEGWIDCLVYLQPSGWWQDISVLSREKIPVARGNPPSLASYGQLRLILGFATVTNKGNLHKFVNKMATEMKKELIFPFIFIATIFSDISWDFRLKITIQSYGFCLQHTVSVCSSTKYKDRVYRPFKGIIVFVFLYKLPSMVWNISCVFRKPFICM